MTDIKNDNAGALFGSYLEPIIKEQALQIYEREKAKAIKELEIAFECAKSDILAACSVEIQQRFDVRTTDMEFVIRVRR